jgi:tripartite motif-containing protein 2/3
MHFPDHYFTMASEDFKDHLRSIAECPVCMDPYSDPRTLPCVHTYCRKCIQGFTRDKIPGDAVACPVCRTEFTMPVQGVEGLPKNFFIEQLKDMAAKETSSGHGIPCSDCNTYTNVKSYCVSCRVKLCHECASTHRRRRHKLIESSDDECLKSAANDLATISCGSHPEEALKLYCSDCRKAICFICFWECHRSHDCSEVTKVVENFREQITKAIDTLLETIATCEEMEEEVREAKVRCVAEKKEIEEQVSNEQLQKIVDSKKLTSLRDRAMQKEGRMKIFQHAIETIEQHKSFVTSFISYAKELRNRGTASCIAFQFKSVHERAIKLTELDNIKREVKDLGCPAAVFHATEMPALTDVSLTGQRVDGINEQTFRCIIALY